MFQDNGIDLEIRTFYSANNASDYQWLNTRYKLGAKRIGIWRLKGGGSALRFSLEKTRRSSSASGGGDAVVNKGGRYASRGFNPGVGAYFTVCGPISRRQSEPARIHHRVTPRNNLLRHNELLSKPSYLFISPLSSVASLVLSPSSSDYPGTSPFAHESSRPSPLPFTAWQRSLF